MMAFRSLRTLAAALLVLPLLAGAALAQDDTRTLSDTVPLAADGRVSIDTYKGSITVTTWDRDEVRYAVTVAPDGDPELVADTRTAIDRSDTRIRFETDYDDAQTTASRDGGWRSMFTGSGTRLPFAHYTLTIPRTASLDINDYKSEIDVRDLQAELNVETYKGTMQLEAIDGPADVETYKGSGTLRAITGALSLDTYKGRLRVEDLTGSVEVDTYKGDVEVIFAEATGDVEAETYKGEVTVYLPAGTGFDLDAELGDRADLRGDFDVERFRSGEDEDNDYRGAVNGGGIEMEFDSYKGTFRIRER